LLSRQFHKRIELERIIEGLCLLYVYGFSARPYCLFISELGKKYWKIMYGLQTQPVLLICGAVAEGLRNRSHVRKVANCHGLVRTERRTIQWSRSQFGKTKLIKKEMKGTTKLQRNYGYQGRGRGGQSNKRPFQNYRGGRG